MSVKYPYYQVVWQQEIAGINFCIAHYIKGYSYRLFVLDSQKSIPDWDDIEIAVYYPAKNNQINIEDFFQKKINSFVLERYKEMYEILKFHYTMKKTKNIFLSKELKDEFETMLTFLVEIGYIKNFYSTRECIVYERKPRTFYEKLIREKNIYRITFIT